MTRTLRTAAVALVASVGLLVGPVVALAAPRADAPQLSIAIDNAREVASKGDLLEYAITVTNQGTSTLRKLRITQSVPTGTRLVSAPKSDQKSATQVLWSENLAAGDRVVLHTTVEVGTTPETLLRLATVACASVSAKAPPVVCATDSDLLPAGAKAAASSAAARTASGESGERGRAGWYAAIAAGLLLLAASAFVVLRRRRANGPAGRPAQDSPATSADRPEG